MEIVIPVTGAVTDGILATDGTTYATLTLLHAAGKTAAPGYDQYGIYPSGVAITTVAGGGGPGSQINCRTNVPDTPPTVGFPVHGSGQQFIRNGFNPTGRYLLSNVEIVSKTAGDTAYFSFMYD